MKTKYNELNFMQKYAIRNFTKREDFFYHFTKHRWYRNLGLIYVIYILLIIACVGVFFYLPQTFSSLIGEEIANILSFLLSVFAFFYSVLMCASYELVIFKVDIKQAREDYLNNKTSYFNKKWIRYISYIFALILIYCIFMIYTVYYAMIYIKENQVENIELFMEQLNSELEPPFLMIIAFIVVVIILFEKFRKKPRKSN